MGFFDRLFGKKSTAPPLELDDDEDIRPTGSPSIQGPAEFVRAVQIQQAYWTHHADEQAELEARGIDHLNWNERLRLHHLICLQRLRAGPERAAATEKCLRTVRSLIAVDSPYRPRSAMIWQGEAAQPGTDREPDIQGQFLNPSLTHLGCLEVFRVDAKNQPVRLDFVGFDELSGIVFAPSNMIRAAKLFYEDGRGEVVLVPMLYGVTWEIGNEFDRAGRMTRFVAHLNDEQVGALGASGLGVGQQDFSVHSRESGSTLFGLSSVAEISFPLDMSDPRFDAKARTRGIDPEEVRRRMETKS